jgi:signal transduction histidine kinase
MSMAEPAFEQANTSARILVVEDDPVICKLYENALGKKGYQISLASSFHAAKELLCTGSFDVIISDIFLDEEDGLALLASSQAQYPDTPVILITGRPTIETASAAVRLNAYEYLVKPVSLEVLSDAITRAVAFKIHKADRKKIEIDITEKKRLEAIAEAANLMDNLGYIFAGIRHEIGNPLNSVKMALSVLDKNLDRYPRQTIREFVGRSLGELSRVEYLLKALKNFSMFETPQMEDVHLGTFMANFMSLVEEDFSRKGIHIFLDVAEENICAATDHRAFHQMMLNVMTNAADALSQEERPMIDIMVDTIPGFVRIRVRDNGCGMSQEEQKNLFRPFFTSKPQGTGLGLVIVKKMVSKMNGTINIASSPLAGTTVTMTLPEGRPLDDGE